MITLVERCGQYKTDYDTGTSVKRIKTLRKNVVSNTAVCIIDYGLLTIEWRGFTWKVRCPLSHVILTMGLPLNTEFDGGYSTENDANTTVYDTVSTRVTDHPGRDRLDPCQWWMPFDEYSRSERSFRILCESVCWCDAWIDRSRRGIHNRPVDSMSKRQSPYPEGRRWNARRTIIDRETDLA
jgi:hypothetical protein